MPARFNANRPQPIPSNKDKTFIAIISPPVIVKIKEKQFHQFPVLFSYLLKEAYLTWLPFSLD